jgi:hypothetical protein
MQRLSSLAFGTRTGRFLTRFVAVPFAGAYLALAFVQHTIHTATHVHLPIETTPHVLLLGALLLALLHVPPLRVAIGQSARVILRGLRRVLIDLPWRVLERSGLMRVFQSRWFRAGLRLVVRPLVVTGLLWAVIPRCVPSWPISPLDAVLIFLAVNALMNSRAGRNVEEMLTDWLVQGWQRFGIRILAGLFWAIADLFKAILENTERLLYTVDEWLRFRSGESRFTLVAKGALGIAWFFLAYVVRFCVNVLIEPQINPIKHFPVVTVSHKLLALYIPQLAGVLALTMEKGLAYTIAPTIIASIPGVFGFLVWELQENWRLYAANRRDRLSPVIVGDHGETMARLMKPGFHSGTLPKRFAKLRRAERRARAPGDWKSARKHLHALQRIEVSLRRYVEREFVALLGESRRWQGGPPAVGEIRLASNRIRIAVHAPDGAGDALWIVFEVAAGWLVADLPDPAWTSRLLPPQQQVLSTALLGLYKSGGVELVRQQVEDEFPSPEFIYDVTCEGLAVWSAAAPEVEARYDLRQEGAITGRLVHGSGNRDRHLLCAAPAGPFREKVPAPFSRWMPTLDRAWILFSDVRVTWQHWIDAWELSPAMRIYPSHCLLGKPELSSEQSTRYESLPMDRIL